MPPTLSHVLLSPIPFFTGWAAWQFGGHWVGFVCVTWAWFMREFAQSARPKEPFKVNWTMVNTRNFLVPVGVFFLIALVFEFI